MPVSPETCSTVIQEFDAQGWHRTATEVDTASGRWLLDRLKRIGASAEAIPFAFSRVDFDESSVRVGGKTIDAVPLVDSCLPESGTVIRGTFGGGGDGSLALVQFGAHGMAADLEALRTADCAAVVACIEGAPGGASLLNAWHYDNPEGPPIVQVPGSNFEALRAAQGSGTVVEIRCGATRTETEAHNIRADIHGKVRNLAPLVVLTPRSGWWHCAGERGGGLAIWLELVRLVRDAGFARDVIFLATTGHELGFLGAKRYFDANPTLASSAKMTLHLGANIGAAGAPLMVRSSDDGLLQEARAAKWLENFGSKPKFATSKNPAGEAGVVYSHGGRFVSFIGPGFALFHSSLDRWPQAINPTAIAAAGDAVFEILQSLDGETGA